MAEVRPVVVTLTAFEKAMGWQAAMWRRLESEKKGRPQRDGYRSDDSYRDEVHGCFAEIAVAKYLGLYWSAGIGSFFRPDVGGNVQVKWTRHEHGALTFRTEPRDDVWYYLVTGEDGRMALRGRILGKDVAGCGEMRTFGVEDRPPQLTVRQSHLLVCPPLFTERAAA